MALSYSEAIEYLYGLQRHGIKLGLENIRRLTAALGEPQQRFRSVHIAGTNGKGSTAAMAASILRAAGYRTGLYTSPHLIDFTERMRVQGEPISREQVVRLTERVRDAAGGLPLTFFEFTTAMAFLHFSDSGVEFAAAEVGMGGRYDATNVLAPCVSVITNVDFDHQAYLGDTIERIAFEKAGIIKPGVPVVTAAERPEAMAVIREACRERKSPLYRIGVEIRLEGASPESFAYDGVRWSFSNLACALMGRHQIQNAACAVAALEQMEPQGARIDEAAVRSGLKAVQWEGRLERFPASPSEAELFLDGAHNPAGARVLRAFLESRPRTAGRIILVLGILRDKDADGILSELVPLAAEVVVTRPRHERAMTTVDLSRRLEKFAVRATVRESVEEALRYARSAADAGGLICVTGSLYTIGEARACLKGSAQPSALRG